MEGLMYVKAYIDDLLVLTKGSFEDHLKKLSVVLRQLKNVKLCVKAPKLTFAATKIEYLGYILTRDGLKPQPEKISAILAIKPPTNVKELQSFLGFVQYYRNMWEKQSHLIAPLTDLVAKCGHTKVTKLNKTKKNLGIGIMVTRRHSKTLKLP